MTRGKAALPTRNLPLLDITADAYHADELGIADTRPSLSSSIVQALVNSSPGHAWTQHPKLNPTFERVEEDKFSIGTTAHALFLQGDDIADVLEFDDWRKNDAKDARDASRAAGRIPLLAKDYKRVRDMVDAAHDQLPNVTPGLFVDGAPEQTLVWEDDGVLCRARFDYLHFDLSAVDDYKTTAASAHPRTWSSRTMYGIGADVQVAFYLRGLEVAYPELRQRPTWRYVVQETFSPYALSVVEVGEDVITLGMDKVEKALALWRGCLERDEWPLYPSVPVRAELPAWVEAQWMERAA